MNAAQKKAAKINKMIGHIQDCGYDVELISHTGNSYSLHLHTPTGHSPLAGCKGLDEVIKVLTPVALAIREIYQDSQRRY